MADKLVIDGWATELEGTDNLISAKFIRASGNLEFNGGYLIDTNEETGIIRFLVCGNHCAMSLELPMKVLQGLAEAGSFKGDSPLTPPLLSSLGSPLASPLNSLLSSPPISPPNAFDSLSCSASRPHTSVSESGTLRVNSAGDVRTCAEGQTAENLSLFTDDTHSDKPAKVKRERKAKAPKEPRQPKRGHFAIPRYCEMFKAQYNSNPVLAASDVANLMWIGKTFGEEHTNAILVNYFSTRSNFLINRKHPVVSLKSDINVYKDGPGVANPYGRKDNLHTQIVNPTIADISNDYTLDASISSMFAHDDE